MATEPTKPKYVVAAEAAGWTGVYFGASRALIVRDPALRDMAERLGFLHVAWRGRPPSSPVFHACGTSYTLGPYEEIPDGD